MYSESDLEAAVAAGAMTAQQAASFRDYVASTRHAPKVDEEQFRLLTGFNDIFVTIAAVILLVAMGWIGQYLGPRGDPSMPSPLTGVLVAATAWGLAENFTRERRMALPSIVLLLAFIGGVFAASAFSLGLIAGPHALDDNERLQALVAAASAALAGVAAWLHWRRFHVPITVAAGVAAVAALVAGLVASGVGDTPDTYNIVLAAVLILGIGVFLLAMRWDSSDPRRETRRSDVAFWLHLLAAPMIVHPIFALLGLTHGSATAGDAAVVIALYVILGLTALAIDRRALLVSALAYVLFALNSLFREYGAVELSVALTALIIGSALLLLSAFWTNARRTVVKPLPSGLQARLPVLDRALPAAATA
jgi:MFS family permease